jgi:hypothetical protein
MYVEITELDPRLPSGEWLRKRAADIERLQQLALDRGGFLHEDHSFVLYVVGKNENSSARVACRHLHEAEEVLKFAVALHECAKEREEVAKKRKAKRGSLIVRAHDGKGALRVRLSDKAKK